MAEFGKLVHVETANRVGGLADLTDRLKSAGINILSICAWVEGDTGHMLLYTTDNEKACQTLSDAVDKCSFMDAIGVIVPNKPGQLNELSQKLADAGIGINVLYATTTDAPDAAIVLSTTDNTEAAEIL